MEVIGAKFDQTWLEVFWRSQAYKQLMYLCFLSFPWYFYQFAVFFRMHVKHATRFFACGHSLVD